MTAVDVDALDAAREAIREELGRYWENDVPEWAVNAILRPLALPELLAEVRRGRALREAVEDLAAQYTVGDPFRNRLSDLLAATDAS